MLNTLKIKNILFFFVIFLSVNIYGQKGYFEIKGGMLYNHESIEDVIIKKYNEGELESTVIVHDQSAFKLKFDLNKNYIVEFNKKGLVSKKIIVNTTVPNNEEKKYFDVHLLVRLDVKKNADARSLAGLPILKYYYDKATNSFITKKITDKKKPPPPLDSLVVECKRKINKQKLLFIAEKKRNENLKELIKKHNLTIEKAENIYDSIINAANKKYLLILQKAKKDSLRISEALNRSTKILTENEFEKMSVNENDFENKTNVKNVKKEIEKLEKIKNKSQKDLIKIKSSRLKIRKEFMKDARYQLEIDRLNAKTKEDSAKIERREEQLSLMEADMQAAEKEIEVTRKELQRKNLIIKNKDLEIKNKNIILFSFSVGTLLLLILILIIYKNYINKKKTNKLLEKQNVKLEKQYEQINLQNVKLKKQNDEIMDSINYGKRIQDAILPSNKLLNHFFSNHFIFFKPKDIVSGDFYWFSVQDDNVFLAAVDCTGHGVPGAFMSLIGNSLLNHIVNEKGIYKPSEILKELNIGVNKALSQGNSDNEEHEDGMDITLCKFDKKNKTVELSAANHTAFIVKGNEIKEVEGDELSIGEIYSQKDDVEFTNHLIPMDKNATLYMFSDGYPDQFGGKRDKKFMYKKLKKLFIENQDKNQESQIENIEGRFEEWKSETKQTDDVLIIGVKLDL